MTIQQDIQRSNGGDLVTLLEWDLSVLGGGIFRFSEAAGADDVPVVFNGNTYTPLPFSLEGFEKNSKGTLAQPTLTIADVAGSILSYLQSYGDLIGTKVTRIKTFSQYLNLTSGPRFPDEVFFIERKSSASKFMAQFTLSSLFDMQGLYLPRRLVLKDVCTYVYRVWRPDSGDFYCAPRQCPYTALNFYKYDGTPTDDPAQDVCGKRYSDCVLRYPRPQVLPTRAFPGASHVRR